MFDWSWNVLFCDFKGVYRNLYVENLLIFECFTLKIKDLKMFNAIFNQNGCFFIDKQNFKTKISNPDQTQHTQKITKLNTVRG